MANKKVTELTAVTTATANDVMYIVANTAGTSVSRKITVNNLGKFNSVSANTTGTVNNSITGSNYQTVATAINLTKDVFVLDASNTNTSKHFYLADGEEGQVMHLVAKESAYMNQVYVWADNFRIYNESGIKQALPFYPFTSTTPRTVSTIVFAAGAWNIDTNQYD